MSTLKQLKKIWDQKLKESGFDDIEADNNKKPVITQEQIELKQAYFTKAMDYLEEYDFTNTEHKQIWMLHANGDSIRHISDTLKISKSKVHRIVRAHAKRMMEAY